MNIPMLGILPSKRVNSHHPKDMVIQVEVVSFVCFFVWIFGMKESGCPIFQGFTLLSQDWGR